MVVERGRIVSVYIEEEMKSSYIAYVSDHRECFSRCQLGKSGCRKMRMLV